MFDNKFGKCGPMFKILLPVESYQLIPTDIVNQ